MMLQSFGPMPMPGDFVNEAVQQIPNDPMLGVGAVGVGAVLVGGRMGGRAVVRKLAHRQAERDGYALPMFIRDQRNVDRYEDYGNVMSIPKTGSILALGTTRSGKTETGKWIVSQMQADENEPMIVYDHKDDYQQFFDEIGRDYIKLSASGSTATWNIFEEINDAQDAGEVARSIFADAEQAGGSSGAYFGPAARQVFTISLKYILAQAEANDRTPTNATLVGFFQENNATDVYEKFQQISGFKGIAEHLDPESDKKQGGVWSNLQLAVEDYFVGDFRRGLITKPDTEANEENDWDGDEDRDEQNASSDDKEAEDDEEPTVAERIEQSLEESVESVDTEGFSIREYMQNPEGKALVLDYPYRQGTITTPIFRLLIDLAAREALVDQDRGSYFILDEIAQVPKLQRLDELVNVGAGRNIQVFVTLQSVAQLRESYGEEAASAVLSGLGTTMLLRSDDPKSVEYVQAKIGKEKTEYTAHVEKANLARGRQKTMHREMKPEHEHVFSEAEINSWRPGEGVLVCPQSWAFGRVKLYDE